MGLIAGWLGYVNIPFLPDMGGFMSEKAASQDSSSSLKIYLRLLSYIRPYLGYFALSILGFLIFASTQPMLGYILKYFVDGLSNPAASLFPTVPYLRDLQLVQAVPLLIVLIAFWQGVGSFLGNYFLAKVSLGLVHDLRVALFNNLLTLPNRYFDSHNSGHVISRITFNVTMVTGAATDAIKVVIREGMTVIFLFATLLWMNWKLTLVMVAILPVIGLMVSSASKKFRKQSKKIQVAMGDVTHVASETIQGYRVVRSFGGEAYEQQRFLGASSSNTEKQLRMTKTSAVYTPLLQMVSYSALDVLMFLEPFGLLAVLPLPTWAKTFIPAYKATRVIAEVFIESMPQSLLQSYILVVVMGHVNEGTASASDLAMLGYISALPKSITISMLSTMNAN